jgi:hypothetical protein
MYLFLVPFTMHWVTTPPERKAATNVIVFQCSPPRGDVYRAGSAHSGAPCWCAHLFPR